MLLWTEKERQRMKEALAGVLECVRVMEISSEVFASEVEPTGLLPMEMTLARQVLLSWLLLEKGMRSGYQLYPETISTDASTSCSSLLLLFRPDALFFYQFFN